MVLDKLALKHDFSFRANLFKSHIADGLMRFVSEGGKVFSEKVVLIKPKTYMNLSGEAVFSIYKWFKVELKDIIVICDDFSLPFGTLRIRAKGSSGGHNGLKSIINLVGSKDFPRLRFGIGAPVEKSWEQYVLEKISEKEMEEFISVLDKGVEAVECFIKEDIEKTMSRYNRNFLPEEPPSEESPSESITGDR